MSEYRVGIIAEGPTDIIMIEQIIKLFMPKDKQAVVTAISPTETELMNEVNKPEGFGWGSVYRICRELEGKLLLQKETGIRYDLIIVHVDGDVSNKTYESANIEPFPEAGLLPCYISNKTVVENCKLLESVVSTWIAYSGDEIVYCIPFINMDLWAAFSLYPKDRSYLFENMSEEELNSFLLKKGKKEGRLIRMKEKRVRKNTRIYHAAAQCLTNDVWKELTVLMEQAKCFESDYNSVFHHH